MMPDVLLFHHALGVTPGIEALADELRAAGSRVIVPDLYDGQTFDSIAEGVAHADQIGFDAIFERGASRAEGLGDRLVVVGFSLGVLPAQRLAQTRPGVVGAVLCHSAVPITTFSDAWPAGVAVQLHFVEDDPWAKEDLDAAREVAAASNGSLYLYQGTGHLVADSSHPDYDEVTARLIMQRSLDFIADLEAQ
jgi:dienelactone hydrolase